MEKHPENGKRKTTRGFTLLLAVLISSVLIALGSAIFDIVAKEITLSSAGRESQFSFYAADTGVECALYWDLQHNAFATSSTLDTVQCGGDTPLNNALLTRQPADVGTPTETLTTTFTFPLGGTNAHPCVNVRVVRSFYPTRTTLESAGYNTCVLTNPFRLERTIQVTY